MKNGLLKIFIGALFLILSINTKNSFGQTVTITSANNTSTNGITSGSLADGQTAIVLFGFKVAVSGSSTINQFNLNGSQGGLFSNGKLYRTAAGGTSFSGATLVSGASVTFSGNNPVISNISETITNTDYTYFLVADLTKSYGTIPGNVQFSFAQAVQPSPYTTYTPSFSGVTFSLVNPTYTLTSANSSSNGITQGNIVTTQTGVVLFGFGISANVNTTVSTININSSSSQNYLSYYLGNGKLYKSSSNTFSSATLVSGATVSFSSYQHTPGITISGLSQSIGTTTVYYFIVGDFNQTSGVLPATVQFNFSTSQTNAFILSNSSNVAAPSNVAGTSFTFSNATYTITDANAAVNGITQGAIYPGQSGIVLYGFGVNVNLATSVTAFNLYNTYNHDVAQAYFNNGKIYRSSSSTFSIGTATLLSGATVSFGSSSTGITISGINESYTANASPVYYFIVGDFYTTHYGAVPATTQFSLSTSLTNSIVQSSPSSSNIAVTSNTNGTNFSLANASIAVTGYNSTANGITTGALAYGQTAIVLFGFSVTASGNYTINEIDIPSNNSAGPYFTNGKLYRSTTASFANATLVSGTTISFGSPTTITGLSQTLSSISGTATYYYFLVGDFTASTSFTAPATLQFNFHNGTISFIQSSPYTAINTPNTTNGTAFSIINTENWTGATNGDFTNAANFSLINGGGGVVPGATMVVKIGSYTNPPNIVGNTTIGGLTFAAGTSPTINVASGKVLTLSTAVNILAGSTPTISGPGTLTIPVGTITNMSASSVLTLSGAVAASNAGTFNMASTAKLNLTGNSTLANTGTFILGSDASGSATIGALSGTSAITGTFIAQRYITGGTLAYRGYRLLSSPVSDPSAPAYYNMSFLSGSGSYLTGAAGGGFDVTGNPTIYLYREDQVPVSSSLTSGNYRAVTKINNAPSYSIGSIDGNNNMPVGNGFLYFYRGNNSTNTTIVPANLTFNNAGTINQGHIVVRDWFNNGSDYLSCTTTTANTAVRGFSLVGNPYPSSIDWNKAYGNNSSTSGIYAPNVSNAIYVYNTTTKNYSVYTNTGVGIGVASGSPGGSNIIPQGQGFFVRALTSAAQLMFNEDAKVTSQPGALLLNAAAPVVDQHLRLQLSKDSVNKDETVLVFNSNAKSTYVQNEDALYLKGTGLVSLSNGSSDNAALAINQLPFSNQAQSVPLTVAVTASGRYQLNLTEATNIPDMFDVWLIDNYKKDSLDIKHNPTYSFDASSDAASTGSNRFKLVIRPNMAKTVHLLSFSGTKSSTQVKLAWTAENEANYTRYTLERTTNGGKSFTTLDSLTSENLGTYNDLDPHPVTGLNQYRLKQVDVMGNVSYSNTINIMYAIESNNIANNLLSVYPNPATSTLHLAITPTGNTAGIYKITIINSTGITVKSTTSTDTNWQSDVSSLMPGTYFVQVINTKDNTVTGKSAFIKL